MINRSRVFRFIRGSVILCSRSKQSILEEMMMRLVRGGDKLKPPNGESLEIVVAVEEIVFDVNQLC